MHAVYSEGPNKLLRRLPRGYVRQVLLHMQTKKKAKMENMFLQKQTAFEPFEKRRQIEL